MLHAPPPPPCRANAVQLSIGAQGATQGLMISVAVSSTKRCLLPVRPVAQVLVAGHLARTKKAVFPLGTEEQSGRLISPGKSAWAILRFENYCGPFPGGTVAVRLTLGGQAATLQLPRYVRPPVCGSRAFGAHLEVSIFARR